MSNVREQRAPRKRDGAFSGRGGSPGIAIAFAATAVILLGLTAGRCAAADAAPQANGVSNGEFSADGRKWTPCAAEYGTCRFNGTRDVLYGTPQQHVVKTFSNSAECNNGVFGDPAPGVEKRCAMAAVSDAPAPVAKQDAAPSAAMQSATPIDLKAPPGQGLRCSSPSSQVPAAANGDLLEADTPSDGTRLFAVNKSFALVFATRLTQADTLNWQIRDAWNAVRASGRFPVAAGATLSTLSCASSVAGYFAVSASLERAHGQLESRGTRPAGIATFGVLPDVSVALPAVRFPYEDLHRFGEIGRAHV